MMKDPLAPKTTEERLTAATARAEAAEKDLRILRAENDGLRDLGARAMELKEAAEAERDRLRERVKNLETNQRNDYVTIKHWQGFCVELARILKSGTVDNDVVQAAKEIVAENNRLRAKCAPVEALLCGCGFAEYNGSRLALFKDGRYFKDVDMDALTDALNGFAGVQP